MNGVEGRERQRHDQHEGDDPVEELAADAGEHLAGEGHEDGLRVGQRGIGKRLGPENDDEGDRNQRVDEHAIAAFEVHRDLGVVIRIGAFADVAGGRLHGDHVPRQQEAIGDIDLPPAKAADRGEEARPVDMRKSGELAEVRHARIENPGNRDEGQRDHRQEREDRRERGAEANAAIGRDEEKKDAQDRDDQRRPGDESMDRRETGGRIEVEAIRQIERGQDHVERRHGKPSEPIGPGGEAVDVLGEPRPAVLEGRIGVGWRSAGALRHHGGQLSQEEAEQPTCKGDEDRDRDRRGAEGRHHDRGDTGHQDRAGEADDEGAPPARLAPEVARSVFQVFGSSGLFGICSHDVPLHSERARVPLIPNYTTRKESFPPVQHLCGYLASLPFCWAEQITPGLAIQRVGALPGRELA